MRILRLAAFILTSIGCAPKKELKPVYPVGILEQLSTKCNESGESAEICNCKIQVLQSSTSWQDLKRGAIKKRRGVGTKGFDSALAMAKSKCTKPNQLEEVFKEACSKNAPEPFCDCSWKKVVSAARSNEVQPSEIDIQPIITQAAISCVDSLATQQMFLSQCEKKGRAAGFCKCVFQKFETKHGTKALGAAMIVFPWGQADKSLTGDSADIAAQCQTEVSR